MDWYSVVGGILGAGAAAILWRFVRSARRPKDQIDILLGAAKEASKPKMFKATIKYDPTVRYCYRWRVEPIEDMSVSMTKSGSSKYLWWARAGANAAVSTLNKKYAKPIGVIEEWEG